MSAKQKPVNTPLHLLQQLSGSLLEHLENACSQALADAEKLLAKLEKQRGKAQEKLHKSRTKLQDAATSGKAKAQAKAKGHPWDPAKGFDHSAPISELVPAGEVGDLAALNLSLEINGEVRQQSLLDQMIWNVPEILHELSKLWQLRAGDLVFMGTPSGVAALKPGDRFSARLENVAERHGVIAG